MSNGFPSLTALLGLVAVAGYQNRDKIGDWVKSMSGSSGSAASTGGLGDLITQFKDKGLGDIAQSWVGKGANDPVTEDQLHKTLGPDIVTMLEQQTGLSRNDLLKRLAQVLPQAVDGMTPDGRLPS